MPLPLPPSSGKINMVSVFLGIFQILAKVNYFALDIVAAERRYTRVCL